MLLQVLPSLPNATEPSVIAQGAITFFSTWIGRCGGIVAFVGAIKLALSVKNDDAKEQLLAVLTMVSGFMIQAAVGDLSIFNIPTSYTLEAATTEFQSILKFIGKWIRRVGMFGMFVGGIMFGISVKDSNASMKVNALKTMAAGGIVAAIASILSTFV